MSRSLLLAGFTGLVRLAAAQQSGWTEGQVNTTMCYWDSPRVAVVRDTLYIDGGQLWWKPGMSDGSYGAVVSDDNPLGTIYQLNFGSIFTPSTANITNVFTNSSKAAAGGGANNVAPNYIDGALLANDYEWMAYGGLLTDTGAYTLPGSQSATAYQVYAYGPPKQFFAGYVIKDLPSGLTRYVTNGAGVSVPSENLGFYFSGVRSSVWGPIYHVTSNNSENADVLSTTMVQVDLAVQNAETWKNFTIPGSVPGRISPEIVWVPVSKQGVLIAIGGVVAASWVDPSTALNTSQTALTKDKSPGLMTTVAVYDIAAQVWYQQPTSGTPPMLTQGCTVVASAQDGSSHNIYWYGGWDGIDASAPLSDDVWILSVPSFMWVKAYTGTSAHARAAHKCAKPYPDQMVVVGGFAQLSGTSPKCLDGGLVQVFNLSSLAWVDKYNPDVWSQYTVPSIVTAMIGGNGAGSATRSSPSPSGFANSSMTALFGTAYNSSKITNWYPYKAAATISPTSSSTPSISAVPKGSSTPSYLGPVLGVVLGLFFLTLLIVALLIWRRRHLFKHGTTNGQSENGTLDNRRWVTNWLRTTPADAKAPTVTTDEMPSSPSEGYSDLSNTREPVVEVSGSQVYEMMDTSRLNELHDTTSTSLGLHPMPMAIVPNSPASRALHPHLAPSNSVTSTLSRVSHSSDPNSNPSPRPPVSPVLDSATPSGAVDRTAFISGVSEVSETDKKHLRGISDTGISTDGRASMGLAPAAAPATSSDMEQRRPMPPPAPEAPSRAVAVSPLTPPTGMGREGSDYLGAKDAGGSSGGGSPGTKRRSNFSEELGEDRS